METMTTALASADSSAESSAESSPALSPAVALHWIPLGAGQHVVRLTGKVFEAGAARLGHRGRCELYHSSLEVTVPRGRYVVEMTPVPDAHGELRGVVAGGPVGVRWAGRLRLFRYEIRRWRDGVIPDVSAAVATRTMSIDLACARHLLHLVPSVPTPVWGRDELAAGEMWNSNSVTAWLLARGGFDMAAITPPPGGRAPGWDAGLAVASRDRTMRVLESSIRSTDAGVAVDVDASVG